MKLRGDNMKEYQPPRLILDGRITRLYGADLYSVLENRADPRFAHQVDPRGIQMDRRINYRDPLFRSLCFCDIHKIGPRFIDLNKQ